MTIFFSHQNFVPNLEGTSGTCITVMRVEDVSPSDLFQLSSELFENVRIPEGSILMYGSASYLFHVGTGGYAGYRLWRGVRVCPLVPMILTMCPGLLVREISELTTWLVIVYDNNSLGMHMP